VLKLFSIFTVYKNAAIGLALIAFLAALSVQSFRLDRAQTDAVILTAKNESLAVQLDAQNAGIKALEKATAARGVAADKANVIAGKTLARAEAVARAIERAPVPVNCEQAISFLVDAAARDPFERAEE
jgi:hypothetical protein